MTETAYDREKAAVLLIHDHGPLTLNADLARAVNGGGSAPLTTIHALERGLLVEKVAGKFTLTVAGKNTAARLDAARKDSRS